ncbi:topoisomerase DNA-binding C4 zinc finger domain-containing protein [Chloroflexota bacterium]
MKNCPKCGRELEIKRGKTGMFMGCLTTDAYKYLIPFAFSVK